MNSKVQSFPGLPTDKELVLREIPMPTDVNANGDIFGGWQRLQAAEQVVKVTEAMLTYVAIDEHGRPRPVHSGGLVEAAP